MQLTGALAHAVVLQDGDVEREEVVQRFLGDGRRRCDTHSAAIKSEGGSHLFEDEGIGDTPSEWQATPVTKTTQGEDTLGAFQTTQGFHFALPNSQLFVEKSIGCKTKMNHNIKKIFDNYRLTLMFRPEYNVYAACGTAWSIFINK